MTAVFIESLRKVQLLEMNSVIFLISLYQIYVNECTKHIYVYLYVYRYVW